MKYWREATKEEFDKAPSRAQTKDGKYFIVITKGEIKDIIIDLLGELNENLC